MKCLCKTEPEIIKGEPVREGEKAYWRQIFVCKDPNCSNFGKQIGERRINIFDNTDVEEEEYSEPV